MAEAIEYELLDSFGEADSKSQKGSTPAVHDEHNPTFLNSLSSSGISPKSIVHMSSQDFQNPEQRAMAEQVRQRSLQDSVRTSISVPTAKITHKGEEAIESLEPQVPVKAEDITASTTPLQGEFEQKTEQTAKEEEVSAQFKLLANVSNGLADADLDAILHGDQSTTPSGSPGRSQPAVVGQWLRICTFRLTLILVKLFYVLVLQKGSIPSACRPVPAEVPMISGRSNHSTKAGPLPLPLPAQCLPFPTSSEPSPSHGTGRSRFLFLQLFLALARRPDFGPYIAPQPANTTTVALPPTLAPSSLDLSNVDLQITPTLSKETGFANLPPTPQTPSSCWKGVVKDCSEVIRGPGKEENQEVENQEGVKNLLRPVRDGGWAGRGRGIIMNRGNKDDHHSVMDIKAKTGTETGNISC
ncbi:hypothetical protein BY996DRAFT_6418689 [Phakopsora pachyrhizi]|nr:hypothetical protein BY996DRAFT_6418689 [Phakopsora pachyrhizi]